MIILVIVLLIRYYDVEDGQMFGSAVDRQVLSYETCLVKKAIVEAQAPPDGLTMVVDCVDEKELPALREPGSHT